jgi:hypothetical protein
MNMNLYIAAKRACLSAVLLVAAGCYSVTARPDGGFKVATKPSFEQRQDFFLWGLVGETHIDTQQVCPRGTSQIQSQLTFVDGLLTVVTLGIYSPQSARIWCK